MPTEAIKMFSGTSNRPLAQAISEYVDVPLAPMRIERFSDGEMFVEICDNVRGAETFLIQSTSSPANDHLMELLITIDALKRASARSICAVIPYYGYARQDRKVQPRTPITAKLVSDLIAAAGATRVLAVDLHAGQIQGFFDIPFDHLFSMPVLLADAKKHFRKEKTIIVSPDAGGVERARAYAKRLGVSLAIIDKRRPQPNVAEIMRIVGEVKDLHAIIVDDMVDTASTLVQTAEALINEGAKSVTSYASHPVLSGEAIKKIEGSCLNRLVFTDTIRLSEDAQACSKIEVRSIAPLLAKAVRRIHLGESVSSLFV